MISSTTTSGVHLLPSEQYNPVIVSQSIAFVGTSIFISISSPSNSGNISKLLQVKSRLLFTISKVYS